MDRHFLEFWGNLMISAAKSQKQMEDMAKWMSQGFSGFDYLSTLFGKCYGLEDKSKDSPDYLKTWKQAQEEFWKSFRDYLDLLGVVPRDEHLALVKKYEDLKQRAADQEETIKHLRMLLDEKVLDQGEVIKGFQDLVREQTGKFQELMNSYAQFFQQDSPSNQDG